MGIDGLELRIRLEQTFNILIDNEEFPIIFSTPGMLHDFIWQRLQGIHPGLPCLGFPLTERIDQAVLELPGTRNSLWKTFERMIPQGGRQSLWIRLGEVLNCPLPALELSSDQSRLVFPKDCSTPMELGLWLQRFYIGQLPIVREEFRESPPEGAGHWTEATVWREIQIMVADIVSTEAELVTRDARMVQDLGID
jgi:hypothetical protein